MSEFTPLRRDLSVFNKLELEQQPVGVKFLYAVPDELPRLEKKLALCEMFAEAQHRDPFHADIESQVCAGTVVLGMEELGPFYRSGQIGPCIEVFKETRANRRVYEVVPMLPKDTCASVAFARLEKLWFDPDLLIVSGPARKMEIILRALSWTIGQPYESRGTSVMGCAGTFVYPYLSGKVNFSVAGLTWGHNALGVGKEGDVALSIPWDWLPTIVENLAEVPWVPEAYSQGRDDYLARFDDVTH